MTSTDWAARMAAATPAAEQTLPAGTVHEPHDGETTDINAGLAADLLAEPDTGWDPYLPTTTTPEVP